MPKLRKRKIGSTGLTMEEARHRERMVDMPCFFCKADVKVPKSTKAVLCGNCTITLAGPSALPASVLREKEKADNPNAAPKKRGRPKGSKNKSSGEKESVFRKTRKKRAPNGSGKKYVPTGKPRGWHLHKVWTDPKTGITYRLGIAQPLTGKQVKKISRVLVKAARKSAPKKSKRGRGRPKGSKNKKSSKRKSR
jgi:hypothetical protein